MSRNSKRAEKQQRLKWKKGTKLDVKSKRHNAWLPGRITKVLEKDWLEVQYALTPKTFPKEIKEVHRFSDNLRLATKQSDKQKQPAKAERKQPKRSEDNAQPQSGAQKWKKAAATPKTAAKQQNQKQPSDPKPQSEPEPAAVVEAAVEAAIETIDAEEAARVEQEEREIARMEAEMEESARRVAAEKAKMEETAKRVAAQKAKIEEAKRLRKEKAAEEARRKAKALEEEKERLRQERIKAEEAEKERLRQEQLRQQRLEEERIRQEKAAAAAAAEQERLRKKKEEEAREEIKRKVREEAEKQKKALEREREREREQEKERVRRERQRKREEAARKQKAALASKAKARKAKAKVKRAPKNNNMWWKEDLEESEEEPVPVQVQVEVGVEAAPDAEVDDAWYGQCVDSMTRPRELLSSTMSSNVDDEVTYQERHVRGPSHESGYSLSSQPQWYNEMADYVKGETDDEECSDTAKASKVEELQQRLGVLCEQHDVGDRVLPGLQSYGDFETCNYEQQAVIMQMLSSLKEMRRVDEESYNDFVIERPWAANIVGCYDAVLARLRECA